MVTLSVSGCNIMAWSGILGTAFSVDEACVKEAVLE